MISKNFARIEFACKCGCGTDTVDVELAEALQDVRDHFNAAVTINSGCRCRSHNSTVGGALKSQHLHGRGVDFIVTGVSPDKVQSYLEAKYKGKFGIGKANTFTHLDTRTNGPARWTY